MADKIISLSKVFFVRLMIVLASKALGLPTMNAKNVYLYTVILILQKQQQIHNTNFYYKLIIKPSFQV